MDADSFVRTALRNPANAAILDELARLRVPDAWLVSGCLVQTVWNVQTGRTITHGIADYDVFYFDPDPSWDAEDAVIRAMRPTASRLGIDIQVRNQARVHLWYREKHGRPYPELRSATQGIDHFLTRNTMIGLRFANEGCDVYAPHAFDDVANMIVRPNLTPNFSAEAYAQKAARWKSLWPELTVIPAEP
ncbi:hypothetical protein X566_05925 [Afipia sp. P52-10]|jgi:hypothetical protein|uniref:nucleotidyltransferase family protein n=1 Tax=Afipia sp. P52-10 TaxID=1429916 RepID=UPI0003DEFE6C|nr:nucleotidyltransferase family protein [Afipia sp. P52-10]ETR77207.1 hypothetical protein X566_05925 [Afipia sp. P52-10]